MKKFKRSNISIFKVNFGKPTPQVPNHESVK